MLEDNLDTLVVKLFTSQLVYDESQTFLVIEQL